MVTGFVVSTMVKHFAPGCDQRIGDVAVGRRSDRVPALETDHRHAGAEARDDGIGSDPVGQCGGMRTAADLPVDAAFDPVLFPV